MIGIIVDEGLPQRYVGKALKELEIDIEVETGTFLTSSKGGVDEKSQDIADTIAEKKGWDRVIYVTDQPLVGQRKPETYRVQNSGRLTVVSVTALGVFRPAKRLAALLSNFLDSVENREYTTTSVPRLFAGLVRANQPGRLLPVMTSVLVAIAATGGFGVFYGSIWNLALTVSIPRTVVISLVAMCVLTSALILVNRLWQRPSERNPEWLGRMDNAVTFTTIFITALFVFLLAMVGLTVLSLVIVPPGFLVEQTGLSHAGLWEYIRIGWFSAALGVLAGAIGSNFDKSPEIRSATYSPREHARRLREGAYDHGRAEGEDSEAVGKSKQQHGVSKGQSTTGED